MFYKKEVLPEHIKFVENTTLYRDFLESKLGKPKIDLGGHSYIEINLNENSWRVCLDFEWLYRDKPPLISMEELGNVIFNWGKVIEVNGSQLFSDEHSVLTKRGWLKANELQNGDKVIGSKGEYTITNIVKCGKRPDAPISRTYHFMDWVGGKYIDEVINAVNRESANEQMKVKYPYHDFSYICELH